MFAWYAHAERILIPAQLVLVMAGMGATLTVRDFAGVLRAPASLAMALALQWLLVPAAAAALALALGLGPGWTLGLLLIASAPPAGFSNLFTFLGRGNVALAVSVTAVGTVGAIVTVPAILSLLAGDVLPSGFSLPTGRIVADIGLYLLAPLAGGMVIRRVAEPAAPAASRWLVRGSLALMVVITVGALGSGKIDVGAYGWAPPARIVGLGVALALLAPHLCRLAGRYDDDALALSVQVSMRNMGVALMLVPNFFPGRPEQAEVLYSCLFYAGIAMWLALPSTLRHRRGHAVALGRAPWRRPAA